MPTHTPTMRLHLWLEDGTEMMLGLGRAMLLTKVDELGSLNKAAKALGMSYRAAWGKIKQSEEMIGQPLVEKSGPRSGFTLTPLGRELTENFKRWHAEVEACALDKAAKLFPWGVRSFDDAHSGEDS